MMGAGMIRWCVMAMLAAGPVAAQDCANPVTQADMTFCANEDFMEADLFLNEAYRAAEDLMRQADQDLPADLGGAEEALREAQRAWIAFRDAACISEGFQSRGGSMEPMIVAFCLTRLTEQRTADLQAMTEAY
jgi:uncharacterized protein YecT (DUF1311 family)